jgi:hypothetical protein
MAKVIVRIDTRTSELSYEIDGVLGNKCKDITDLLREGLDVIQEKDKEEMYLTSDLPDFIDNTF